MKVWVNLCIRIDLHVHPENIAGLVDEIVSKLHDKVGAKPTFHL